MADDELPKGFHQTQKRFEMNFTFQNVKERLPIFPTESNRLLS
jgi:hypothetical protein